MIVVWKFLLQNPPSLYLPFKLHNLAPNRSLKFPILIGGPLKSLFFQLKIDPMSTMSLNNNLFKACSCFLWRVVTGLPAPNQSTLRWFQ